MTREEIESVYSRDVLDRNWWGNFPEPLDLLGKDFPKTADIYRLMPVCARIALHMGGELPRFGQKFFSANIFIRSGIFVIAGEYTKNTVVHFSKNILSI